MVCYHPLTAYRSKHVNPSGKRSFVFNPAEAETGIPVTLPCGQCSGCRLERSRQWAVRCVHESKMHERNCFITLTYNDDHLPEGGNLVLDDLQRFFKRYRKRVYKDDKSRFRVYYCGEYGERLGRPHYHALIFGHDFNDRKFYKTTVDGEKLYTSETLQEIWSEEGREIGFCTVGDVTFRSAAYCARYIMKKMNGEKAEEHYQGRTPEFSHMSRGGRTGKGGIGKAWYEKYKHDTYPSDDVAINGKLVKPPRYYDTQFQHENPELFSEIKKDREKARRRKRHELTSERLKVREEIHLSKLKRLKRSLK